MGTPKASRSLSHTVWICLAVITLIFLCASLFSLFKINHLRHEGLLLTATDTPAALISLRLINGIEQSTTSLHNQLLFKKKTPIDNQQNFWSKSISPAFAELLQLADASNDTVRQKMLNQLHQSLNTFQQLQKDIQHSIASDNFTAANKILEKQLIPNVNTIRKYAYAIHQDDQQDILSHVQYIKQETTDLYFTSILFLILGFTTSVLFGIIIIRSLTRPIKRTLEITNDLAIGKLDIDVDISGTYEFEALNESLTRTTATLKNLRDIAERVANGDYTQKVKVKSEEDRLAKTINIMIDNFNNIVKQADAVAAGNYDVTVESRSKHDSLAVAINNMTKKLARNAQLNKEQSWLKDGLTELANVISGQRNLQRLSNTAIQTICHYIGAPCGAIYINDEESSAISIQGTFGLSHINQKGGLPFQHRNGIIEQVARDKKPFISENISHNSHLSLSGIISSNTISSYIHPLIFEGRIVGIIEIASLKILTASQRLYIEGLTLILSSQIYSTQQHDVITQKNNVLKKTKKELTLQKSQLEKASKYKTEFLTNVSHELRTPLNSLLSFSKLLKENKEKNLSKEQIKSLSLMEKSGHNLLTLINDLLDLAKVDAGKLDIYKEEVSLHEIENNILEEFKNVASEKGLQLTSNSQINIPKTIITDGNRLQQILRNFMSNAIKFTSDGSITLRIKSNEERQELAISVTDTGIGIPESKQSLIFEAFQQADGTTTRNYGGTGLGLSISTQLAFLLNGHIELKSTPSKGSTFTLIIPYNMATEKSYKNPPTLKKHILQTPLPEENHKNVFHSCLKNDFKNKNILLIEKNMRKAFKIKEYLKNNNNDVTIAYSLKNSQQHLTEKKHLQIILLGSLPKEEMNNNNFEIIKEMAGINHYELHSIDNEITKLYGINS